MADQNTQTGPKQPEQVVYTTQPKTSQQVGTEIPEEYLTDEYLYPKETGGPNSTEKKRGKGKLILIILFIIALLIIGSVVAMSMLGRRSPQTSGATLTYWGLWDDAASMQEMIKEYQQAHPEVKITYEVKDAKDSYRQRLLARIEKGTGPDIFRYHNTWVPEIRSILSAAPPSIVPAEQLKQDYYPVIAKDVIINNAVVGLPLGIDGTLLVYNKKALSNAGIATPPKDWEALIDAAKKITVKNQENQIQFSGIALGTAENIEHFSDIIAGMFLQNGVNLVALEGNQNANSVLEAYTAFATPPNDTWNETMPNSILAFANEKVAMIFVPYWQLEVLRQLNPDLDFGVSIFPQVRGGTKKVAASYWVEGVSSKSAHKDVAWDFLKFLSTKESLIKLAELDKKSGRSMIPRPYPRKEMASLIIQDPFLGPVVQQAPDYDSMPLISRTFDGGREGQGGLNDGLIAYLRDAVNTILFGGSIDAAVNTFSQGVTQIMDQFKTL